MKYASNNIRNILIAGHAGSGKTTLTEALVYFSGAAERMGRVEDGTTISDFDPEEAKRKASLSASVVPVEYEGIKYNLIDAPGLFDFEAGEYEGIRAAESVLVVEHTPIRELAEIPVPASFPRDRSCLKLPEMVELKEHLIDLLRKQVTP